MKDLQPPYNTVAMLRWLRSKPKVAPDAEAEAALQRLQDETDAVQRTEDGGWRRTYRPEFLRRRYLNDALRGEALVIDETESTNADARAEAATRPLPFFCFAQHQSAGRGRRGKQWLALPGDAVMLSGAFAAPPSVAGLSVAAGAVLWRALGGSRNLRLKWPNDLLDKSGNKVGGVLIEVADGKVVIGAGINRRMTPALARRIAALGGAPAGCLAAALPPPLMPRYDVAVAAARALAALMFRFPTEGFAGFASLARRAYGVRNFTGFGPDGELLCG